MLSVYTRAGKTREKYNVIQICGLLSVYNFTDKNGSMQLDCASKVIDCTVYAAVEVLRDEAAVFVIKIPRF